MAVNNSRSMNADLRLGSQVDGQVKVLAPDRGGNVELIHAHERASQLQPQYSISDMFHTYSEYCMCSSCV